MKYCVIIPTYNNEKTLEKVISDVLEVTNNLIIVNDGSTDNTDEILKKFNFVNIVAYPKNKGKGYALRQGFRYAADCGFDYAITLDSDGQHFASDINLFIKKIGEEPGSFLIGSRILPEEKMRKGSSFANRFSNFWFRFITGIKLSDTQTGFRFYPLNEMKGMKFYSDKYEFELEVLVRLAWRGVKITEVPINVFYPSKEERVSHFRPFKDFFRISILNTIFVLLLLLYIKPLSFFKRLKKENLKDFLNRYVLHTEDSSAKLAFSVATGIFMGIVPIWGFQLVTAIALAFLLKLNKFIVIVAANISIFPLTPLIMYISYVVGGFVLNRQLSIKFNMDLTFKSFADSLFQYIVGSLVFAVTFALVAGLFTFVGVNVWRKKMKVKRYWKRN